MQEMAQNADFYARQFIDRAQRGAVNDKQTLNYQTLLSETLCDVPSRVYLNNCKFHSVHDAHATGIQEQLSLGTKSHTWSSMLELAGLATVLGHRIRSYILLSLPLLIENL